MIMKLFGYKPSEIRKFLVGVTGALVVLAVSLMGEFAAFLPAEAASWIGTGVAFATAVGVFLTKNAAVIDGLDGGLVVPASVAAAASRDVGQKPDELIRAVKDGKNIHVNVDPRSDGQ